MLSISVFELADLVSRFRNIDFSKVSKTEAITFMKGEMMHLPESEREVIAEHAYSEQCK